MIKRFILVMLALFLFVSVGLASAVSTPTASTQAEKSTFIEKAKVKMALKQNSQAMQDLEQARRLDPRDAEIVNLMGLVYLRQNYKDAAKTCFKQAIRLDPKAAGPYNNLGAVYHANEQYKSAAKYYRKAIERDPKFLLAYFNLGNVYFAEKKYLQGVDIMHKIVQIDPEYLMKERSAFELGGAQIDQSKRYFYYAKLYAQVGDVDKVVYFLQKSIETGFKDMKEIAEDRDFAPFQQDPRIQALVHR